MTNSSALSQASRFRPADVIAARRELARRNLADFACLVDIPTVPLTEEADEDQFSVLRLNKLVAHHALLLKKLQGIENGSIPNLMVLMPPGSAKSTYVDVVFVPWFMSKKPRRNVILASYASDIAKKQGRRARQLIKSKSFRNLMDVELKDDQHAADEWALTNGSEYMSGGLLSGLTGNRAALGVVDDPIKGREAAESETIREKTWDTYVDDFCSRLIPGAPQVMILTRWHEDDPAGRILPEGWDGESGLFEGRDGRAWDVLCLPAIADRRDDPLGRQIGQTLWPEWFSLEHWAPFQRNRRTWSSLYQQKPTADEGTFFRREWFRRYTPEQLPKQLHKYLSSDHAPTGEDDSDYSCVRVWGVDPTGDLYMLDGFRHQETMDITMERVVGNKLEAKVGLLQKHKPFAWFPEDDNNWKAVEGFVKKAMREQNAHCVIAPISPHGADKAVKAQAFQGMASMGRVWIPVGPEGDEVIDQYCKFPGGKNDDEVDAAGVIGRAIDQAHPALAPPPAPPDPRFPAQMSVNELIARRTRARLAQE
jgi:predicted phage terminase large subunit-like protein